ncbi:MAG: hypothetical protein ABIL09_10235, partial [Gemmatimonadota bacterium]
RLLQAGQTPVEQGHRLWNATWLLIDFLRSRPLPAGCSVLEVGAGWGLAGIYCARAFASPVTAVDVDPAVFPFLELHARLNKVEVDTVAAAFHEVPDPLLEQHQALVGADICFRGEMVEPLYDLLTRALASGVRHVALSDPGRRPFRGLAERCVAELGAEQMEWKVAEPLLPWEGEPPTLTGQVLALG